LCSSYLADTLLLLLLLPLLLLLQIVCHTDLLHSKLTPRVTQACRYEISIIPTMLQIRISNRLPAWQLAAHPQCKVQEVGFASRGPALHHA
jgi:hypothetical protein